MITKKDIVNLIVTNGRPDKQLTYKFLTEHQCDNVYLVCDDLDEKLSEYQALYGDRVLVFDKVVEAKSVDTGVNNSEINHVVFARNVCYKLAKKLGYKVFFMFDDDISKIDYRYLQGDKLKAYAFKNFSLVQELYANFMEKNKNIYAIGLSHQALFMGGANADIFKKGFGRFTYNAGIYFTERLIKYISTGYEDCITSIKYNSVGKLMITMPFIQHNAIVEGRNEGGMADVYASKMYEFKMLTKVFIPAQFVIKHNLKHSIKKNYYPMIINERYKKYDG